MESEINGAEVVNETLPGPPEPSLEAMRAAAISDVAATSAGLNELVRSVFMFVTRRNDEVMNSTVPYDAPEEEQQAAEDAITVAWNKLEEATPERWVVLATQHLQQGLMALRRAIEAPGGF